MWQTSFEDIGKSMDIFKSSMNAMVSDGTFAAWANRVFPVFFLVVDANEDNQITKQEFNTVYNVLFPNPFSYAENCFRGMDTDGNTFITPAEYNAYATGYFIIGDTIDQSKYFWGPYF